MLRLGSPKVGSAQPSPSHTPQALKTGLCWTDHRPAEPRLAVLTIQRERNVGLGGLGSKLPKGSHVVLFGVAMNFWEESLI